MLRSRWLILAAFLVSVTPVAAQPAAPSQELLALVPKDFSFCLAINDLRDHWQQFEQATWFRTLKQSPVGQAVLSAPEFRDLTRFVKDLKEHLDVDLATVRDDVLGDAMVFAYRPPQSADSTGEQGLFLVKARKADVLEGLIERLNKLQFKADELKSLDPREHQGVRYYRRVHAKHTFFYSLQGPLLAVASSEDTLKQVIQRPAQNAPVVQALRRAGAERLAAFWINPRAFDAELKDKAAKDFGPEGEVLRGFMNYWQALESVVLVVDRKDADVEFRLALLAGPGKLPAGAKEWFTRRGEASELWQRFPANSIFTLAGRTDFRGLADELLEFAPEGIRKLAVDAVRKNVKAAVGLDPFADVLPNLGPDWGVCVLPASAGAQFPQAIFALAVKPGSKDAPVDQSLMRALNLFVSFAVFQHNRTNADEIQMRTLRQGDVDVKYLTQNKLFPPGFQPAWALKDGYMLLATSPAAIEQFKQPTGAAAADGDVPMVRFAPIELAKLVRQHRERVLEQMSQKGGLDKAAAGQNLDALLTLLDLCQHVTLSHRQGERQLSLIVRFGMIK